MIEITHTSSGRSIEIRQLHTAAAPSMEHHAQNYCLKKRRKKRKNTNFLTSIIFIVEHSHWDEVHNAFRTNSMKWATKKVEKRNSGSRHLCLNNKCENAAKVNLRSVCVCCECTLIRPFTSHRSNDT